MSPKGERENIAPTTIQEGNPPREKNVKPTPAKQPFPESEFSEWVRRSWLPRGSGKNQDKRPAGEKSVKPI